MGAQEGTSEINGFLRKFKIIDNGGNVIRRSIRRLFRPRRKGWGRLLGDHMGYMPAVEALSPRHACYRYVIPGGYSGTEHIALVDDIMAKYRKGDRLFVLFSQCFAHIRPKGAQIGMAGSDFTEYRRLGRALDVANVRFLPKLAGWAIEIETTDPPSGRSQSFSFCWEDVLRNTHQKGPYSSVDIGDKFIDAAEEFGIVPN